MLRGTHFCSRYQFIKQLLRNSLPFYFVNGIRKCNAHNYASNESNVTVTDMKKVLRLHGYGIEDGYTCLLTKCPICKSTNDNGHSYINKTSGFFLCSVCDSCGQWKDLEKVIKHPANLKDLQSTKIIKKTNELIFCIWKEIISKTSEFSTMPDDQIHDVLEKFNLPIIPEPSKVLSNTRLSLDETSLYFPLQNLTNKNVGYIEYQHGNVTEMLTKPVDECSGIFLLKSGRLSSKEQPLIIVPSIGDALSIVGQKITGNIVCLPYGLNRIPQQILPVLEKFQKIIIWVSVDGISHIKNVARKLGESRCLIVRATGSNPTPLEALRNNMDLKTIMASASPIWHKSITTFKSLRDDVLADLQNIEKVQGVKWKRYPVLNKLLRGHRRGELTVITGPTGCGKTTFCSEYSLDLALQEVNTLWGSFEIRNARLVNTMLQQLAGFSLAENLNRFDEFADIFQRLPIYFLMFHGQQSIKEVMEAVEHATYVHDISHVIIDNVQFMLGIGDEASKHLERFWRQDAMIAAFRTFATRTNCHVTLVMHPRKERDADDLSNNSIFGSAKASQEADNVLIIQDKRLTAIRGKKYLQIAKNRFSGDLGIMPLEFDKDSLSYAAKKKVIIKEDDNI